MIVQLETDNDLFKDIHDINIGKNSDGELIDCMTISIPQVYHLLTLFPMYIKRNVFDLLWNNVNFSQM